MEIGTPSLALAQAQTAHQEQEELISATAAVLQTQTFREYPNIYSCCVDGNQHDDAFLMLARVNQASTNLTITEEILTEIEQNPLKYLHPDFILNRWLDLESQAPNTPPQVIVMCHLQTEFGITTHPQITAAELADIMQAKERQQPAIHQLDYPHRSIDKFIPPPYKFILAKIILSGDPIQLQSIIYASKLLGVEPETPWKDIGGEYQDRLAQFCADLL